MALRLILVGVVASLALDLPRSDIRPVATRAIRSVLVAEPARALTDPRPALLAADEPALRTVAPTAAVDVAPVPVTEVPTAPPVVSVAQAEPIVESPAVPPSPLPNELALLPVPATTPMPVPLPMPAPPEVAVASVPFAPIGEPTPAPIPTVIAVEPMSPLAPVAVEVSPEAAPAPAPAVVEAEKHEAPDPDAAFRKVVSSMASTFAADGPVGTPIAESQPLLARVELPAEGSPAAAPPLAAEEIAEITELELYPGVAYALNRDAEGISPTGPAARAEPAAEPSADASRADRLSEAMKLTGQAVNAWAGLLSQRPTSSAVQR